MGLLIGMSELYRLTHQDVEKKVEKTKLAEKSCIKKRPVFLCLSRLILSASFLLHRILKNYLI